jgi:hypothetical protein
VRLEGCTLCMILGCPSLHCNDGQWEKEIAGEDGLSGCLGEQHSRQREGQTP